MTTFDRDAALLELIDREAIRDCLYRYCRGVDRADEAALRSAYWPDAIDNHGAYNGPVEGFVEWAKKVWATGPRNIHVVTNVLIEFHGADRAAVESTFTGYQRGTGGEGVVRQFLLVGRYCDIFEKRAGEWRIAHRTVVYDWVDAQQPPADSEAARFGPRQPIGSTFPDDPVYAMHERAKGSKP
jgi:hypothetical protein